MRNAAHVCMVAAMREAPKRTGWGALFEWALALGLVALTLIAAASVGLWVAPFALAALAVAHRRNRAWPEAALGGAVGVGSVCLLVAYRNRTYSPGPPSGSSTPLIAGPHFRCGGFDPAPWLAMGLVLGATGLAAYLLFRRTHRDAAP